MGLNRQEFLRYVAAFGAAAAAPFLFRPFENGSEASAEGTQTIESLRLKYAWSPGRLQIIDDQHHREGENSVLIRELSRRTEKVAASGETKIEQTGEWPTDNGPNYTNGYCDANDQFHLLVALYWDNSINDINTLTGSAERISLSPMRPLDVAYDYQRSRIIAAGVTPAGTIGIIEQDRSIKYINMAELTGQGESNGGVQGITLDSDGNIYGVLAYCGQLNKGVLFAINPNTLSPTILARDVPGFNNPNGIVISKDPENQTNVITAFCDNNYFHQFTPSGELINMVSENGLVWGFRGAVDKQGNVYVTHWLSGDPTITMWNIKTGTTIPMNGAYLGNSLQIEYDAAGNPIRIWTAGDVDIATTDAKTGIALARYRTTSSNNGVTLDPRALKDAYCISYDNLAHRFIYNDSPPPTPSPIPSATPTPRTRLFLPSVKN